MNNHKTAEPSKMWSRELPDRAAPLRGAGGFYRTAEGKDQLSGGVPLNAANDAVVAAVRLAYKVAEAQIDRSTRLARRLSEAGDRAVGPGSDRQALDATERLVMKALMSGLSWWEGSVAQGRCPVKRLVAAEYRMLGSMLGLMPEKKHAAAGPSEEKSEPSKRRDSRNGGARKPFSGPRLQIVHKGERRAVRIRDWEISGGGPFEPIVFYCVKRIDAPAFTADLVLSGKTGQLSLTISEAAAPGLWKGAICNSKGVQLGFIEIIL